MSGYSSTLALIAKHCATVPSGLRTTQATSSGTGLAFSRGTGLCCGPDHIEGSERGRPGEKDSSVRGRPKFG
jgi:hypothetical protein